MNRGIISSQASTQTPKEIDVTFLRPRVGKGMILLGRQARVMMEKGLENVTKSQIQMKKKKCASTYYYIRAVDIYSYTFNFDTFKKCHFQILSEMTTNGTILTFWRKILF